MFKNSGIRAFSKSQNSIYVLIDEIKAEIDKYYEIYGAR